MKLSSAYFIIGLSILPFLFLLLPVDALNAYILNGNESAGMSPGQLFKLPIILTMIGSLILYPRGFLIITFIFFLLSIPTALNSNLNFGWIMRDVTDISKYLTPLISYYFFSQLWKENSRLRTKFDFWIYFSYGILALSILASIFGLGTPMYDQKLGDQNIGTRGLFYSGNEVSITFIVLLSFVSYKVRKSKLKFVFLFFNLLLAILISSKTAILGVLLVYVFISISEDRLNLNKIKRIRKRIFLFFLITILAIVVWQLILNSPLIIRFIYFFNKLDLLTFILSARNIYLLNAFDIFYANYGWLEFLFGLGYNEYRTVVVKMIEIDIFDLLFTYGIVGAFLFIFCISIHLYNTYKSKLVNSSYSYNICFILFLISCLTGHTFGSGMAGIFIGYVLSYYKSDEQNIN